MVSIFFFLNNVDVTPCVCSNLKLNRYLSDIKYEVLSFLVL